MVYFEKYAVPIGHRNSFFGHGKSLVTLFKGHMPFLSLNQQCQSIEGNSQHWTQPGKITHWLIHWRT